MTSCTCALAMPNPEEPICSEWVNEISRHIKRSEEGEIFLVGHSLGGPAILRYLESMPAGAVIGGAILVSSPSEKNDNRKVDSFLGRPSDYKKIKTKAKKVCCYSLGQ